MSLPSEYSMLARLSRTLTLCFFAACTAFAQQTSLNLSHDLTTLKIATQNMTPNTPTLDSSPLFQAGVVYANAHSIPLVTLDPAAYYLLSEFPFANSLGFLDEYLNLTNLKNITIDLAGSDIYFKLGTETAIVCNNCQNTVFQNFTLDAMQLPFTQAQVTSVNTAANQIAYSVLPNWEPPTDFNTPRNPAGAAEPLYAFVFRNGKPLASTGNWIPLSKPIGATSITAAASPYIGQLANIQPGDELVIYARLDGPAMRIQGGSNVTINNVAIYAGSQVGLDVNVCSNCTVNQVQVIPRPGTDRLISTNADGISLIQVGQNNTVQRARIKRTGDDGISPNVQSIAQVIAQPGANQVQVSLNNTQGPALAAGLSVQFISNQTGLPLVTASITAIAAPASDGSQIVTFNQTIPALAAADPMVYADATLRGSGLLLQNNTIEELLFARGISVWGILGGTLSGNLVRKVPHSGIVPNQKTSVSDWMTGPSANLTIANNVVDQFQSGYASGRPNWLAGIDVESTDLNQNLIATSSSNQNITVANNFLSNSPYTGIWVQNLNGGSVTGNQLLNVATQTPPGDPTTSLLPELTQPVVLTSNTGVTNTSNTISPTATVAGITSAASLADDVIAPESLAFATAPNLAVKTDQANSSANPLPTAIDGVTVTITDSAGATHAAGMLAISPGQVSFQVPSGIPIGAAVVAVSSGGTITGQGGIMIDTLAPALYSADGSGAGAALGTVAVVHANGTQTVAALTSPIVLGAPSDVAVARLSGTGIRHRDALSNVTAFIGGLRLPVTLADAQGTLTGVDEVDVTLPPSLAGVGTVSIRVVVDGLSSNVVTANFVLPGPAASMTATAGAGQSATAGAAFPTALQSTVRDSAGNPVPNVAVTFSAPNSGASGVFPGIAIMATVTTNDAGVATAPTLTANAIAGAFTVTATSTGIAAPANFPLTIVTPAPGAVTITSVNVAGGGANIAQNAWIEIRGKNLVPGNTAAAGVIWSSAPEFASGNMPTQLGGIPVTVTVDGKPAFLYFFCSAATDSSCASDQINVLTPLDSTLGLVPVVVTNGGVASPPFMVNLNSAAPSFPLYGGSYIVATHADYSLVGPAALSAPGYPITPAQPNETILLFAFGFGLPTTALVNGSKLQSGVLPTLPVIQIGGFPATVSFAGVISPGLYQINVIVPTDANGDNLLTCSYNGQNSPAGDLITVQH